MRDTTLLIETESGYQELDIYENLPISVTYSELEIGNLESRTSPYSLVFSIPGTDNNAVVFSHFYEVNGTNFNPLIDRKCVVQHRGTDIFRGFLRLNAVIQNYDYNEYEVYITSKVSNLASVLGDTTLRTLDWTPYQHDLNYSSITTSWSANTINTDGLKDGDILYPMVNYGLEYLSANTGAATFEFSMDDNQIGKSITYSGNPINPLYFKPAIRLKAVVDKIFEGTEFTYTSSFFETDYFRSIYMDTAQNGTIGPELPSGVTSQNFFRVYTPPAVSYQIQNGALQSFPINQFFQDGYDPLNGLSLWNPTSPSNTGYFKVPYTGNYFFNTRFNYELFDLTSASPCYFRFRVEVADDPNDFPTGNIFWQTPGLGLAATQSPQPYNQFFSGQCTAGQYLKTYIFIEGGATYAGVYLTGYDGLTINDQAPMWDLYGSPFLTTATTIDMKFQMPDITARDFFQGLINQFNLVISESNEQNTFTIEPFPWYFDENSRTERDWNQYLDINSPVRIEPLTFELAKEVNWLGEYNQDETLNRLYYEQNQLVFGQKRFLTQYTIPQGKLDIKVPFAPFPSNFISGSTNVVIPQVYKLGDNGNQLPYSRSPHLMFWVGNRYFYKDSDDTSTGNRRYWYLLSGGTSVQQTTYPAVSHLSTLDNPDGNQFSDLNFYPSTDFYYSATTLLSKYTQNNSYNYFWSTYVDNLYSPEARKFTGKFVMSPEIYANLKLTDKIFIKDASYRIDKIENANLVKPDLTTITLVKDLKNYYEQEFIAPAFTLAPNSPYPVVPPPILYPFVAIQNYDDFLICDRNTPISTFWSDNSSGLVDDATIYTNSGATTLADTGLYLRVTGTTAVYVVDLFGRAQTNGDC